MTDTATSRYKARQQSQGSNTNTWGDDKLNEVLRLLDRGSKGYQALAMTGSTTLTWTNYVATNDGQCAVLKLTGSLSSAANLVVPSTEWQWDCIWNTTGQTITVKTSAGTGVAIPNGRKAAVFCDATDCYLSAPNIIDSITLANNRDSVDKLALETAISNASLPASAGTALVSATDTTAGYLGTKITDGAGIDITQNNPGANESLLVELHSEVLMTLESVGGDIDATITNTTTQLSTYTSVILSGTGPAVLPTFATAGEFVIVNFKPSAGVTATINRNSQTIDGVAENDTYVGDGAPGPIIRYSYSSAGAVISRLIGGSPV